MSAVVSALTNSTTGITSAGLWADVAELVPFIVIIFGFAFGYRVFRRSIKGASKAKVNV